MAPAQDGESTTKTFNKYFNFGIPTDVKNIDAFVREPGPRPQLEVTADLRLPEDTDLFAYNLAGVKSLCEECGIFFHNLDLATEDQEFCPSGPGRRQLMKEAGSTRMTSGSGEFRRAE